jgi:elongation factor P
MRLFVKLYQQSSYNPELIWGENPNLIPHPPAGWPFSISLDLSLSPGGPTMIDVNDLKKGVTFEMDDELYRVLDYHHIKMGRGNATIRVKVRNLRSGVTSEKTFNSGERVQDIRLEKREVQYLYSDGDLYHFMDTQTYEQPTISAKMLGNGVSYLTDGMTLSLLTYDGESIDVELPTTVDLEVVEAEPGYAGDTAQGATKEVTVSSGLKVQTPLFVQVGDVIRIDTRTGNYLTRA